MSELDKIFYSEFMATMRERSARYTISLEHIPCKGLSPEDSIKAKRVLVRGIRCEYFKGLNGQKCLLLSRPKLKRRLFDSNGKFLRKKDSSFLTEDVTVPKECVAILSRKRIKVPLKFNAEHGCSYVDYTKIAGKVWYIYIVPKSVCYVLNEVALIMSLKPVRSLYDGISVYLQNGNKVFLSIVPYTDRVSTHYKVLARKTSLDFKREIDELFKMWEARGITFNARLVALSEPVNGKLNCAFSRLNATLDEYIQYNRDESLAHTKDII